LVQQDSFQQLKCSALSPVAAAAFGNLGGVTLEAEGIVASLGMITIKPAAGPVIIWHTQVCGEEDESEDGAKISTVFMDQPNSIQVVIQCADCSKTAHQAVEWLFQGLCTTPHISWRKSGVRTIFCYFFYSLTAHWIHLRTLACSTHSARRG
jgi:hypothetical protein